MLYILSGRLYLHLCTVLDFNRPARVIITCFETLAPYLASEVEGLGYTVERTMPRGVELYASLLDCLRLNLRLRLASQIHFSLDYFTARDEQELYQTLRMLPWEQVFIPGARLHISSFVKLDRAVNTLFVNQKVKDAVVDRLRAMTGRRPDSGPEPEEACLHLHWYGDQAEIFINTSGGTLAHHGYRRLPGKAPMLETLAVAMLLAGQWNLKQPLLVPFCGSGTLAIEAQWLATNRFPGMNRAQYGFMFILGYQEEVYRDEMDKLISEIDDSKAVRIVASDNDEQMVDFARQNAQRAGVDRLIQFEVADFSASSIPDNGPGHVYLNPPYGERLGDEEELRTLYASIGQWLKAAVPGWKAHLLTSSPGLIGPMKLKADAKQHFKHARFDTWLYHYSLRHPDEIPPLDLKA